MTKSDLKTGMLVEAANGSLGLVMLGTSQGDVIVSNGSESDGTWCPLDNVNEDLTRSVDEYDIVRVYSFSNNKDGAKIDRKYRTLLWERKNHIAKMTLTSDYEAIINYEKEEVKVGCQTIPFTKIQELYDIINKK